MPRASQNTRDARRSTQHQLFGVRNYGHYFLDSFMKINRHVSVPFCRGPSKNDYMVVCIPCFPLKPQRRGILKRRDTPIWLVIKDHFDPQQHHTSRGRTGAQRHGQRANRLPKKKKNRRGELDLVCGGLFFLRVPSVRNPNMLSVCWPKSGIMRDSNGAFYGGPWRNDTALTHNGAGSSPATPVYV